MGPSMSQCQYFVSKVSADDIPRSLGDLPPTVREGRVPTRLGDLYSQRAEEVLNKHAPYCCDAVDFDGGDEYSANVYRTTDLLHVIMHASAEGSQ